MGPQDTEGLGPYLLILGAQGGHLARQRQHDRHDVLHHTLHADLHEQLFHRGHHPLQPQLDVAPIGVLDQLVDGAQEGAVEVLTERQVHGHRASRRQGSHASLVKSCALSPLGVPANAQGGAL